MSNKLLEYIHEDVKRIEKKVNEIDEKQDLQTEQHHKMDKRQDKIEMKIYSITAILVFVGNYIAKKMGF